MRRGEKWGLSDNMFRGKKKGDRKGMRGKNEADKNDLDKNTRVVKMEKSRFGQRKYVKRERETLLGKDVK